MQQSLFEAATDRQVPAGYRAQAARAWDVLEERKRILRGKPLPGQLRPDLEQRKAKRSSRSKLLALLPTEDSPTHVSNSSAELKAAEPGASEPVDPDVS